MVQSIELEVVYSFIISILFLTQHNFKILQLISVQKSI